MEELQSNLTITEKKSFKLPDTFKLNLSVLQPLLNAKSPEVTSNLMFPATREHFEMYKAMGPNRGISKILFYLNSKETPWTTCGVGIFFNNGQRVQLGMKSKGASIAKFEAYNVKHIKIEAETTSPLGPYRNISYLADNNLHITTHKYCGPAFKETGEVSLTIEDGWEMVGLSLTTNKKG